jgi:hypothetical protein
MKKKEYAAGKAARSSFERTMTALFRAPKTVSVPKTGPKKKGSGK